MQRSHWIRTAMIAMVCVAAIAPGLSPRASYAQTPGVNLLVDGDFEAPPVWPMQDGVGEVQVAPGWRAYYLDFPPSYVNIPGSCYNNDGSLKDRGCYWMRPEFRDNVAASFANRVHGGIRSQKYFSYGRMHEAGLYQQVGGITPGAVMRFSIYIQAWMCYDIDKCGVNGIVSDAPANMHLRVGIDPYGGADPFSGNIVWAPEQAAWDQWVEFAVETVAKSSTVTVFTHSRAEWDWARLDNDVYLDDASLVRVDGQGPAPTQPANPTAAPTAAPAQATATTGAPAATATVGTPAATRTPMVTPTPHPDGAVVHTVAAGDTLSGIALQYDVPLDDLYKLNNLTNESFIEVGQEIVIKVVATPVPPTATQAPQATPTQTAPAPTLLPPTATAAPGGGLCLGAFEDANSNGVRDGDEASLTNVKFVISASGGAEAANYITDGSAQSHCLTTLAPGSYLVQATLPAGYTAPFDEINVNLTAGQPVDVLVAANRNNQVAPTAQSRPTSELAPAAAANSNLPLLAMIAIGVIAVVGVVVVFARRGR